MEKLEEDIRESIIKGSRYVFSRFGFKKTTMDDIAKTVHKGKSSIYYYFKSKEDVFQAILVQESRSLIEEIIKACKKENDPQKKLKIYFVTRMRATLRLGNYFNALQDEYFEHFNFAEKVRKEHDKKETRIVKAILDDGVKKGIFGIKDRKVMASTIIIALKGFEYYWIKENNISKLEKNIDDLLGVLFNGIVKR